MADSNTNGKTRQERFIEWNPYAQSVAAALDNDQVPKQSDALLAIAFEISQVRTEIHFAAKGRSS